MPAIRSRCSSSPMRRSSTQHPGEHADPIGDDAHSPVEGIVHRYPDRVLLKLVHVCPVYCRFCFRREMVGPGRRHTLTPAALAAALDYVRAHPEIWEVILTGGDPLILSPRRLRAVMRALGCDRARQDRPRAQSRAGGRSRPGQRGAGRCAQGERQGRLCRAARQPSARTYRARPHRLRALHRRRHSHAEPERAAARRQRRCRHARRADARLGRDAASSRTTCTMAISRPARRICAPALQKGRR